MARACLRAQPRRPGDLWLAACSGGPDSLALLAAAVDLAPELGVRVAAVYVDHGLRPAAAAEADFVRATAARLGVPTLTRRVDTRARAQRDHRSIMEAARLERYAALCDAAAASGATRVLLGHTADDQVETMVMRLLRGTGLRGLAGIPAERDRYVRPLLDVSRAAIEEFLAARELTPVRDPSNDDRRFLRPFVRHDLLPLLRGRVPSLDSLLLTLQSQARAAWGVIEASLGEEPAGGQLAVASLRAAAPAVREARLVRAFQEAGGAGLCASHLSALDRLLASTAGTRTLDLPNGLRAERRYATLRFVRQAPAATPAPVAVPGPGHYTVLGTSFDLALCTSTEGPERDDAFAASFDPDVVRFPLTLRPPRPGDRLRPRGFGHRRKLSDVLAEARVPAPERRCLPLLADEDEVLFVPGVRASERGRPRTGATRVLRVRAAEQKKPAEVV